MDYAHIGAHFGGWNLTEIRGMPVRERQYWSQFITGKLSLVERRTENSA